MQEHTDWGRELATRVWTNPPVEVFLGPDGLIVEAAEGSDAWRHTSYGFVHDSEHALLRPLAPNRALEVSFVLDFTEQFDQAGLFLRASESEWIKAGVEVSDGSAQVGAVVTHRTSDWSVAPVDGWRGHTVTVRASRAGDAVTIRARSESEPWRLVRVAFLDPDASVEGGLFCAAPSRAGLRVRFVAMTETEADAALH
jgi:regulation of enolase protein 1 (concanavalin A-like superfamily)